MARQNPAAYKTRDIVLNQHVSNPVGCDTNTDVGNPAALRVPQNPSRVLSQNVVNPSVGEVRK